MTLPLPHPHVTGMGDVQDNFEEIQLRWTDLVGRVFWGTGSPETVVTAGVGALYLRLDGGAGTTLYVKESGVAKTGWVGK